MLQPQFMTITKNEINHNIYWFISRTICKQTVIRTFLLGEDNSRPFEITIYTRLFAMNMAKLLPQNVWNFENGDDNYF